MKTSEIIKDQIIVLGLELDEINASKKTPMIISKDYQALCQKEREINAKKKVLEKYLSSPMSIVEIEKQKENKELDLKKLNKKKKMYNPDGFASLLEHICRVKAEKSALQWLID